MVVVVVISARTAAPVVQSKNRGLPDPLEKRELTRLRKSAFLIEVA